MRTLGVNQMHMRAGSGKWNNPVKSKAGDQGRSASSFDIDDVDLSKPTGAVKKSQKAKESDGRSHLPQLRSQAKKKGDRQSVPNIDETIGA